jgi:hypothetical protein
MMRSLLFALLCLFAASEVSGSEPETDTLPERKIKSLKDFIKQSHWELHTRTFLMSTINQGELKDDIALAQGAGIGLITTPLKGFQLGLTGYFIFNLASTDLGKRDPLTGGPNRYELGQFDIEDPSNRWDMDRLEELYVRYNFRKSYIMYGRMSLVTPFMNPQDGRMRPSLQEGLWFEMNELEKIKLKGGFIQNSSPRSTLDWFGVGESVGIYPSGVATDGKPSAYRDHVESKGFMMANLVYQPQERIKLSMWNGFFQNVSNTLIVEAANTVPMNDKGLKFYQQLMFIYQNVSGDGGNADPQKRYMDENPEAMVFSGRLGLRNKHFHTTLNYTRIGEQGRYLNPREWAFDPWYTFMPRERNEGNGDVHAVMTQTTVHLVNGKLDASLGYGYYNMPDVSNFRLNKYGMPSYHQVNLAATYRLDDFWKGVVFRMLIASKFKGEKGDLELRYIYNRVNMVNMNFVMDIRI